MNSVHTLIVSNWLAPSSAFVIFWFPPNIKSNGWSIPEGVCHGISYVRPTENCQRDPENGIEYCYNFADLLKRRVEENDKNENRDDSSQ